MSSKKMDATISPIAQGIELFESGCRNFTPNPNINRSSKSTHNILHHLNPILNEIQNNQKELNDGFSDDLIEDSFKLTNEYYNKIKTSYYPHSQALSSSLINLSKESRSNDEWFRILSE